MRQATRRALGMDRDCSPNFIETGAAVHRTITSRRERDHRLLPAFRAHRGVVLARATDRPVPLRDCATRRAALRIVLQPLARKERLLSRGEHEALAAVATRQSPILVHDLPPRGDARGAAAIASRGGESTGSRGRGDAGERTPGLRSPGGSVGPSGRFVCGSTIRADATPLHT